MSTLILIALFLTLFAMIVVMLFFLLEQALYTKYIKESQKRICAKGVHELVLFVAPEGELTMCIHCMETC